MKALLAKAALLITALVGCTPREGPVSTPSVLHERRAPEPAVQFVRPRLAHSQTHTCAISNDGDLFCWGVDTSGSVGLGGRAEVAAATRVPGVPKMVSVATDSFSTCAVGVDGGVYCSGSVFTQKERPGYVLKPTRLPGIEGAVAVALGRSHRCILFASGSVACFGSRARLLGPRTDSTPERPDRVPGLPPMRALYASNSRTCGIDGDGSVWCFGEDACGATEDPRRPSIVPGLERVEQLSLRDDVLCVVTQDGANARRATCIPCGRSGGDKPSATLAPDLAGARAVSADADRGCALFDGGRVACWGELQRGSRYESGPRRVDKPVLQAVGDLTGIVEIDATPTSVCARAEDGGVHCWGRNAEGELGAGSMPWLAEAASASVLAKGPFVDVAAANHTTCGLTAAGRVECFGAPLDADAAKVAGGIAAATALDSTGVQICATVGSAPPICFPQVPAPTDAIAKLEGVRAVARGDEHACAVMHNGTVRCAGDNKLGQLGRPGPASTRPLEVPGLRDVRTIASTESQTCALTASGALYCWGVDDRVRERVGKSSRRPAQVLADVTEIAAGERHFCALGARKELWCWGTDTHGQLGDSAELAYRFEPVVVKTPGEVAHIALGREHSCALLASGDVRCWGNNANGSLGDTVPRKFYDRPFRVPGLPTVSASSRAPR